MSDTYPGLPDGAERPERALPTGVPGIVLWRYRRRTVTLGGRTWRARTYSVTHEPSGIALLAGPDGTARHAVSLRQAMTAARQLGDVQWRRKPFDWTQPIEVLERNDRVRMACLYVGGWKVISIERFDKATQEWADRNGIDLKYTAKGKP